MGEVWNIEEEKNNQKFLFFELKDFDICNIYILADILGNCRKSRFIEKERRLMKTKFNNFFYLSYLKDFIFLKYICNMYKL